MQPKLSNGVIILKTKQKSYGYQNNNRNRLLLDIVINVVWNYTLKFFHWIKSLRDTSWALNFDFRSKGSKSFSFSTGTLWSQKKHSPSPYFPFLPIKCRMIWGAATLALHCFMSLSHMLSFFNSETSRFTQSRLLRLLLFTISNILLY